MVEFLAGKFFEMPLAWPLATTIVAIGLAMLLRTIYKAL